MPSLVRFLVVVAVLAALLGAATVYLAFFVHPNQREMTIRVPDSKFEKPQQ
ncbi:MAG TPA: histidine kinase [Bauldia sp.]|nr:histidine kinase [Bauldia sp.]